MDGGVPFFEWRLTFPTTRSSSRDVRIRVPTFFRTFILVGEPSPRKLVRKGTVTPPPPPPHSWQKAFHKKP